MSKAILIGLFQQQPEMHTQQFVEPYVAAKLNEKHRWWRRLGERGGREGVVRARRA